MSNVLKFRIDDNQIADFLADQESQFLESPSAFRDSVIKRLTQGVSAYGDPLPWNKTEHCFRLREGEVSGWVGVNGHGKSMLLGQVALWLMPYTTVTVASLEMRPDSTIYRMLRQASGMAEPSVEYADRWIEWAEQRLWIYDELDTVQSDRILAMVHYAATKLGSKHIIIDSLMKCIAATDDYSAQKAFIDRLSQLAKKHSVHIHIIHHMRKGHSEETLPDKFDVKGAGEITDLLDNLLIVHRNKAKERRINNGEDCQSEHDCTLRVAKQRHGEWEGDFLLWFHAASQQYTSEFGHGAMPWPAPGVSAF